VAPIDATVVALSYAEGDSVTTGAVAITLAAVDQLHVDTLVDELDIARVESGQPVELTFDALPDLKLAGQVNVIELIAEQGATTAYPVRVVLTEGEEAVRLGMTASVEILVERKEAVVLVPNWALGFDAATGEIFVLVRSGPDLVRTPVVLGLRSEAYSEVLEGLQVGDVVEVPAASGGQGPGGGQGPVFFGGGG
jgi:HlyD family secretion protein